MNHIGNMEKTPKYSKIKSYGQRRRGRKGRREREALSRKRGRGGGYVQKAWEKGKLNLTLPFTSYSVRQTKLNYFKR